MISSSKIQKVAAGIGFLAGLYMLFMGGIHFPMGEQLLQMSQFSGLPHQSQDFLIMLCLVIGVCLVTFGVFTLYFANKIRVGNLKARWFFIIVGIMILVRSWVEWRYPIALPDPDIFNLFNFLGFSLLYFIPGVLVQFNMKKEIV